ncbi:4'-phosphopantetheinyl transferase superfamily protein [Streptomyces sp. WAC08241]|uniref:4'-phosphopantetheinyl transferase family protein n=1 Tax=Streptomyces sp. WAC08241 TaxID=2487421 RepID=UPI000F780E0B|nr:4'-phosphopantetheinyl transferase superfamily protein [Streptomyces sp. WAC08241]RSS44917.1 4'-phosphopantetheinyl transferase superfamily protein [Streptomyces sp. WAC08241]
MIVAASPSVSLELDPEHLLPLVRPSRSDSPVVWSVDVTRRAAWAARLAVGTLDEEEQERAAAFRYQTDRDAYTAAHVGLRLLLGLYLDMSPDRVRIIRQPCPNPNCGKPHGRPGVQGGEIHFSLAHTRGLVLLAFAGTPVGVDVEEIPNAEATAELGPLLHPRETAELSVLRPSERPPAFGRAWARKEAYLKALGTGLSRGTAMDYVGTAPIPPPPPPGWSLTDIADGYAAAVVHQRP